MLVSWLDAAKAFVEKNCPGVTAVEAYANRDGDLDIKVGPLAPCKHLHSEVRPSDSIGHAFCHDCHSDIMIFAVFNNWLARFKELEARLK
jgi:hypothetical protein